MIKRMIDVTEKCFLVTIALFTVGAMLQEVMILIEQRSVAQLQVTQCLEGHAARHAARRQRAANECSIRRRRRRGRQQL